MRSRTHAKHVVILLAAPTLLLVVAAVQYYLATFHHLNPIKGGGFGMFAGHNTNLLRCITLYVVGADGQMLPVPGSSIQGPYARDLSELRVLPIAGQVRSLAEELAHEQWVELRGQRAPPIIRRYIREGSRLASFPLSPLEIRGAEIVLWQYDYDVAGARLRRNLLVRERAMNRRSIDAAGSY